MSLLRSLLQRQIRFITWNINRPEVSLRFTSYLVTGGTDKSRMIDFVKEKKNTCNVSNISPNWCVIRGYAKKANTKAKKGKKEEAQVSVSAEDLMEILDIEKMKSEMTNVIEHLKDEYVNTLKLRTSMAAFEGLMVETDDGKYPLNQLGQIAMKSPNLLIINLASYPQYTKNVQTALDNSGMNINPQIEGNTVAVPLPKVTKEHREKLVKSAKKLNDDAKVKLRGLRQKYSKKVSASKKTHSSDICKSAEDLILNTLHEYSNEADEMMEKKQSELMKS